MQHCRLLFETLCRSVKPFLLFLLRSLGFVPSLDYKTAALSLCQPQQLLSGQGGVAAAHECGTGSRLWDLPGLHKSFLCALHCLMNLESNQSKTTASVTTYRIFPYVTKTSHWNILRFKVLACFNPEFFGSIQTCTHFLSTTEDRWDRMSAGDPYKSPA